MSDSGSFPPDSPLAAPTDESDSPPTTEDSPQNQPEDEESPGSSPSEESDASSPQEPQNATSSDDSAGPPPTDDVVPIAGDSSEAIDATTDAGIEHLPPPTPPSSDDVIPIAGDSSGPLGATSDTGFGAASPPSPPSLDELNEIVGDAVEDLQANRSPVGWMMAHLILVFAAVGLIGAAIGLAIALSGGGSPPASANGTTRTAATTGSASCGSGDHTSALRIGSEAIRCSHAGAYACSPTNKYYFYVNQELNFRGGEWQVAVTAPPITSPTTFPVGKGSGKAQVAVYDNATQKTYYADSGDVRATPDGTVVFKNDFITVIQPPEVEMTGTMSCH